MKNLFRLTKENKVIKNRIIRAIKNLFRLKKENKQSKNRVIRDFRNLFDHEEKRYYYKLVRLGNFWSDNYIYYKSKSDRKALSIKNIIAKLEHI